MNQGREPGYGLILTPNTTGSGRANPRKRVGGGGDPSSSHVNEPSPSRHTRHSYQVHKTESLNTSRGSEILHHVITRL
jgi:hypothetical protein